MNNPMPMKELRRIRTEIYEETKDLSNEEILKRSVENPLYLKAKARGNVARATRT
ncbi:MAG: hypothetical protein LBL34_00760 [Clostridiales bacterium]|nr:hypothetical protein [Clostridiales bacterium]